MMEIVIRTAVFLAAAAAAVFLALIAIDTAIFFKLRSIIPQDSDSHPEHAPSHTHAQGGS